MRLLDRPFVRFLALGGVLFAAGRLCAPAGARSEPRGVALSDDEVLFGEALRLGLDRRDPVVRGRLVANLRFAGADPGASEEALLREADALDMRRNDVVVRRRLVQAMEQRLEARARSPAPSDRELAEYVAAHPERFDLAPRWRFVHVLVSAERHPIDLREAAERLRSTLVAPAVSPEVASSRSDPFLLGNRYGPASEGEIASAFGTEMARTVATLDPGRWSNPIPSAHGLHVVWVEEAIPARQAALALVREPARLGLLAERESQALSQGVASLRSHSAAAGARP